MNAITITAASLRQALARLRDQHIEADDPGAYYTGGIDVLISLLPRDSTPAPRVASVADQVRQAFATVEAEDIAAAVRFAEDHQACRMCGRVYTIDMIRSRYNGEPICDDCWPGLVAETAEARAKWDALDAAPAAALAQEEAQPAHADSLPGAEPSIANSPLPAGPRKTSDATRGAPAAEATAQPMARAPAPPPVLAAEGTSSPPEASHAPPGDASPATQMHPEREAAFRAVWPDPAFTNVTIRARLNSTPGPAVNNDSALYRIADRLGLPKRSELFTRAPTPAPAPAASPEPPPASEPETVRPPAPEEPRGVADPPPSAPAAPALSFPEDAQDREVWEAFDSGMSVRDVGADFGIPLSTLTNTHAQWQLTRRKELAS